MPKSKNKKLYFVDKYIDNKRSMTHGPFPHSDATNLEGALRVTAKDNVSYKLRDSKKEQ